MRRRRIQSEINVVPYIDVMLVLLVIFMVTAPLLNQGVSVELPRASAKKMQTHGQGPIIVTVRPGNRYYLNVSDKPTEPIALEALKVRIAAELALAGRKHKTRAVYVKGDRHVEYEQVLWAMSALQQAGVAHVGLLTKPPQTV